MMERRVRFQRLASLLGRQHEEAVGAVRSAREVFDVTTRRAEASLAAARDAALGQRDALAQGDRDSWMLSCVAYELASVHAVRSVAEGSVLQALLQEAEAVEASARRAAKQAETLLQSIEKNEAIDILRKEQKYLDDTVQILRNSSCKQGGAWRPSHN